MRKPVVALLIVAIAGVIGFGAYANQEPDEKFCTLGLPITPRNFELPGYEVTLQDAGDEPGPDECDGPDRPGRPTNDDTGGYHLPPASTSLPPGREPVVDDTDPRVVLGFDCRYRDADGEVVATAEPNRPDGTCGMPAP